MLPHHFHALLHPYVYIYMVCASVFNHSHLFLRMEYNYKTSNTPFSSSSSSRVSPSLLSGSAVQGPCGACKVLRRRCTKSCLLAPYFPPTEPMKFINAHKIYGASNIVKCLRVIPHHVYLFELWVTMFINYNIGPILLQDVIKISYTGCHVGLWSLNQSYCATQRSREIELPLELTGLSYPITLRGFKGTTPMDKFFFYLLNDDSMVLPLLYLTLLWFRVSKERKIIYSCNWEEKENLHHYNISIFLWLIDS